MSKQHCVPTTRQETSEVCRRMMRRHLHTYMYTVMHWLSYLQSHRVSPRYSCLMDDFHLQYYRHMTEEGGSDHMILPDPVLLPVENLSSYSGGKKFSVRRKKAF